MTTENAEKFSVEKIRIAVPVEELELRIETSPYFDEDGAIRFQATLSFSRIGGLLAHVRDKPSRKDAKDALCTHVAALRDGLWRVLEKLTEANPDLEKVNHT